MALYLKFIEDIDLPCKVLGTYSCELSKSGCISITTCSSLYIYQIQPLRENSSTSLAIKKFSISPSNFMLTLNVGIDINSFLTELPQQNFYEGIFSTELSPMLTGGNPVEPKIIKSTWSPQIINDYDCLLATLSNTGSVQIVTKTIDNTFHEEFSSVFDVSQKYIEMCQETWQNCTKMKPLEQFNELKRRIHETFPTTFTWSEQIRDYCILIVAHACGDLSFWKVSVPKSKEFELPNVTFMNVFNTKFDTSIVDITAMKFVSVGSKALLFVGNSKGQVNCVKLNIDNERVIVNGELLLWSEEDEISIKDIKFLIYQDKGYILIVKGSDLIILMYEETTETFDSHIFHAGNIAITALEIIEDNKLVVVCLSGATKELVIGYENSKINVKWRHLYVNINWYIHQALNFVPSVNRVLFIFLTGPCKTAETKDDKDFNKLVVFINTSKDPLDILLHNTTNSLKSYWDCLEALRCNILLDKQLPPNVQNLEKDYDNMSLYQLRLLFWFSKLSEVIYEQTGNICELTKSYEDILQIFTIKMAINRMLHLLKLHDLCGHLSEFHYHNVFVLHSFLKQVIVEDWILKLELGDNVMSVLLNILLKADNLEYPSTPDCLICGEKLMGVSCEPAHFDMKCGISFMQIAKYPDYKCLLCDCVAHNEIGKEFNAVTCPYCNIYMYKRKLT